MDIRAQRINFVVTAKRSQQLGDRRFSALCEEFGISRPTGYLWLARFGEGGLARIAERSRRPHVSPGQTSAELEEQVAALRRRYPDWGARKLRVKLAERGLDLTRSTIHRILLRHGLVVDRDRHSAATGRFERSAPNELWQMDFKGPIWPRDKLGPLSVLDDHSRYLILLQQLAGTRAELVREQLEGAFQQCGVPEAMLMDHGVPWFSAMSPQGITSLSVWLMKHGVNLHWSRIRHPQTQGKVERFHGELQRAAECRGVRPEQAWFDEYRREHNEIRPHEALGMATPASRWHRSPRRYDANPPAWEYPSGAWILKVDCEGKVDIHGHKWQISRALSGERVQLVTIEERVEVFYCRTLIRELDLGNQRSAIVDRWLPDENPNQKL